VAAGSTPSKPQANSNLHQAIGDGTGNAGKKIRAGPNSAYQEIERHGLVPVGAGRGRTRCWKKGKGGRLRRVARWGRHANDHGE